MSRNRALHDFDHIYHGETHEKPCPQYKGLTIILIILIYDKLTRFFMMFKL